MSITSLRKRDRKLYNAFFAMVIFSVHFYCFSSNHSGQQSIFCAVLFSFAFLPSLCLSQIPPPPRFNRKETQHLAALHISEGGVELEKYLLINSSLSVFHSFRSSNLFKPKLLKTTDNYTSLFSFQ